MDCPFCTFFCTCLTLVTFNHISSVLFFIVQTLDNIHTAKKLFTEIPMCSRVIFRSSLTKPEAIVQPFSFGHLKTAKKAVLFCFFIIRFVYYFLCIRHCYYISIINKPKGIIYSEELYETTDHIFSIISVAWINNIMLMSLQSSQGNAQTSSAA